MLDQQPVVEASLDFQSLSALRAWAVARAVDVEAIRRLTRWDHVFDERASEPAARCGTMAEVVARSVSLVDGDHAGVAALFALVRAEVDEAWQSTYRLDILLGLLRTVLEHPAPGGAVAGAGAHLVGGMRRLVEVLELAIRSEAAMTTGDVGSYIDHATTAAVRCAEAEAQFREAAELCAECVGPAEALSLFAASRGRFHAALGQAADCLRGVPSQAQVERAVAALREAERQEALAGTALPSELRAHRLNLLALLPALEQGILHIDRGKISYIYPFAMRGPQFERIASRLADARVVEIELAGAAPVAVLDTLDLDDIWDGADQHARRYDGVRIVLPDVLLETGATSEVVSADILLSDFGNHYVRFSRELRDVSAHGYFFTALRAAPEHGRMAVSFRGREGAGHRADRLCDFAMGLAQDLGAWLRAGGLSLTVTARPGMFQVVTTLTELSRVVPDQGAERDEILDRESLLSCAGLQVLTNPVPYVIATPLDWTRLAAENDLCDVGGSTDGQVTFRTPNTTVLIELGAPDWVRDTRSAMAEFAASLDGLFAAWSNEVTRHFREVRSLRDRLLDASTSSLAARSELDRISRELEAVRSELSEFAIEYKSVVNAVRSPSLLSSPVAVEELRTFLSKSDFDQRTHDLETETNQVAYDQMNEALEKLAAKVEARSRAKLEIFLAVIAVTGLSGLVQIVQAGYAGASAEWEWASGLAAVVISLVAALFGRLVWRMSIRGDQGAPEADSPAGDRAGHRHR